VPRHFSSFFLASNSDRADAAAPCRRSRPPSDLRGGDDVRSPRVALRDAPERSRGARCVPSACPASVLSHPLSVTLLRRPGSVSASLRALDAGPPTQGSRSESQPCSSRKGHRAVVLLT
jgi:hypothetical protein